MMLQFASGPGPAGVQTPGGPAADSSSATAGEMSPQMLALAAAARSWWDGKRPEGWSWEQHLAAPTTGCDGTAQEQALAEAAAGWIRQGG